jgi:hypothetical protein
VGSNTLVSADRGEILAALDAALASGRDWEFPIRWDDQVSARVVEAHQGGITPLGGCE